MKKIIFIILFFSAPLFSQWFQQNSGTSRYLFSVFFIDSNTGFIAGDSCTLLKTTNGGENWIQINTGLSVLMLNDIYFVTNQTGWVCGDDGIVIKTTNEGENWTIQNTGTNYDIWSIHFVSELTGWAAASIVLKTTNGGSNWFEQSGTGLDKTAVYFISNNTGFTGGFYSNIYKTTNNGINWFMVNGTVYPHRYVLTFSFPSSTIGWTAGDGVIFKSTNSGESWNIQWSAPQAYTIYFTNELIGWCAGYGLTAAGGIFKTTNGGNNWIEQFSTNLNSFYSSYFINESTGWVVGERGSILKTTNRGEPIGIKQISSNTPKKFSLYQNYPNPFNPVTKIKFDLSKSNLTLSGAEGSLAKGLHVRLTIYDILGREIAVLVNENLKAGTYEAEWNASNSPSGAYFYKLVMTDASSPQANPLRINYSETKKMVLLK